jgi:hypothetical protein
VQRGDPGDEQVVGMVGEVVAGEGAHPVVVAVEMRGGDRHQVAVAGRHGDGGGPIEAGGADEGGGDQDGRVFVAPGPAGDVRGRGGVSADEPADQPLYLGVCHAHTIGESADAALTPGLHSRACGPLRCWGRWACAATECRSPCRPGRPPRC